MLNYKVRARTQNLIFVRGSEKPTGKVVAEEAERGTDTFAACSRAELGALIALPRSLFALVTSMEKDFGTLLGAAKDTCRPPGSILARQSSVSWESIWDRRL